jgi:hypothetical protein
LPELPPPDPNKATGADHAVAWVVGIVLVVLFVMAISIRS